MISIASCLAADGPSESCSFCADDDWSIAVLLHDASVIAMMADSANDATTETLFFIIRPLFCFGVCLAVLGSAFTIGKYQLDFLSCQLNFEGGGEESKAALRFSPHLHIHVDAAVGRHFAAGDFEGDASFCCRAVGKTDCAVDDAP